MLEVVIKNYFNVNLISRMLAVQSSRRNICRTVVQVWVVKFAKKNF